MKRCSLVLVVVAAIIYFFLTGRNPMLERQLTFAPHGHILTNTAVFSADSQWIVYDIRSDVAGSNFDGNRIERVHIQTGKIEILYQSNRGAGCGVVTCSPLDDRIVFIHGPEDPTPDWSYNPWHRRGVILSMHNLQEIKNLDACNILPPFTPGALRGGSHVHTFDGAGEWVAFTYEDHVLATLDSNQSGDRNQRNVGISVPIRGVEVPAHPRNHPGSHFSVLVTRTVNDPKPGTDEISRAFEESWIGTKGYRKADGTWQKQALAFQGEVRSGNGNLINEVFVVDLPEDITQPSESGPLEGTKTTRPQPPKGTQQRRITFTEDRKFPGIQGPRHWLRSSPDGSTIAYLMKDDAGVVQLWLVATDGQSSPRQLTNQPHDIASAFSWSPDGTAIAHSMDECICITDTRSGATQRLTLRTNQSNPIRPEAVVFSPNGKQIAYVRTVHQPEGSFNQIFVLEFDRSRQTEKNHQID